MKKVVFYSWQSDRPNSTNRGFIQQALERAAKAILADDSIEVEPVVDRDTSGIAGSPDIAGAIFAKIAECDAFVPDVSLITPAEAERPCPNPNVLLELGFAIRVLGWERIVMVMNTAYGAPNHLPFDLRGRRVVTYVMQEGQAEKAPERRVLEQRLTADLRGVFEHQLSTVSPSLDANALEAITAQSSDRVARVRQLVGELVRQLTRLEPDLSGPSPSYQAFVAALDRASALAATFGRVAVTAAMSDDRAVLAEMYRGLEPVAQRYDFHGSGTYHQTQFAFWRFIGYQLLVNLVAAMIREDRWEAVGEVLDRELIVDTNRGRQNVPFTDLCADLNARYFSEAPEDRLSIRADLLKEMHSREPLASVVDFQAFMDADYFLFLRANLASPDSSVWIGWLPESVVYLKAPPRYLLEAKRIEQARRLATAVGLDRPELFRDRLLERHSRVGAAFPRAVWPPDPLRDDLKVIHELGSR